MNPDLADILLRSKEGKHNITRFLFPLFVLSIPIHQTISAALLAILLVVGFVYSPPIEFGRVLRQGWDSGLYMVVLILGLTYTSNQSMGYRVIETSLSLVALPIVFSKRDNLETKELYRIAYWFCGGLFIAFVICLIDAFGRYIKSSDLNVFFGEQLTSFLPNTHSIYFSYYLIFALTFCIYIIFYSEWEENRGLILALCVFFFVMLLLMVGSTAVIALLFSLLYFVLKFIFSDLRTKGNWAGLIMSISFIVCLFAVSWWENGNNVGREENYWERFVLWESAVRALPNWYVGVGTGDFVEVLNTYYRNHGLTEFAKANFNTHNQFIDVLFITGLPGLITLVIMLGRPIYRTVRQRSAIGFLSLFPFLIYGMTEVFLGRFQGVVFFALLHQSFIAYTNSNVFDGNK